MAAVHRADHLAGAVLQAFDHLADFLHRVLGALGQVAHFVGHHGEAAAGLAGPRRLDGGVERQQVGLLGDGADHLQHRADLLAAAGQRLHLLHGRAHLAGQLLDGTGGAADHAEALAGGVVGAAGGFGGLGGAAGDVLGGGAHLVGGSGHLFDFTVLLLHAGAGLAGDGGGLVGGAAGVLHRAFHVGDHRLQLVEEAVEPAGQFAQFVLAGVVQAAGQVAFAAGDVLEHAGHPEDRPGHAAGGEPHQQQADNGGGNAEQQLQPGALGVARVQLLLQFKGRRQQGLHGHVEQHGPGFGFRDRLQRREHLQVVIGLLLVGLAFALQAEERGRFVRVDLGQAPAKLAGVRAMTGEQARRAEDADGALAAIQALAASAGQLLQVAQADIHAHHRQHPAVLDHREGQRGDEGLLAGGFVEVRVQQTGLERLFRAVEPVVEGAAVKHRRRVADHLFGGCQGAELAIALRPIGGETAHLVAAEFRAIGVERVAAVQGIGLEHQVEAEQLRVGLQGLLHLLVQVLAQELAVQLQFLRQALVLQHLAGEVEAVLVGRQEVALDGQRLHLALPFHALASRGLQHLRAVRLDQRGAGAHAVERDTDQHGDDGQQAEAGQQGDLPLDGKSVERHGMGPVCFVSAVGCRQRPPVHIAAGRRINLNPDG
ncbi:hypothetical protein D9M71_180200 [compost metagenome]